MRDVSHKLRRLLFLVPFVARETDGVPVDDLAEQLGVDRDQLLEDLDLLSQVGPPDGDPGEYLLVSVEDGSVYVDLPQRLTRPLRLTPAEGCSLLLGIKTLRESGIAPFDDALFSAERKLLTALGKDAREAKKLADGTVVTEPDEAVARHLRQLITAARTRSRVEMHYGAASSHTGDRRSVDPYGVVQHAGHWYVVGHCHKRGDVRTFRIDRIASLNTTDDRFEIPDTFDLETYRRERLYVPSADAVAVHVRLDPLATARVGATWPAGDVTRLEDGSSEIVIDCEGFEWLSGWVLGFGRHAEVVGPESARSAVLARVEDMKKQLATTNPRTKSVSRKPATKGKNGRSAAS